MTQSGMIHPTALAIIPQMWDDGARQVWDDDSPKVRPRSAQKSAAETGWISTNAVSKAMFSLTTGHTSYES